LFAIALINDSSLIYFLNYLLVIGTVHYPVLKKENEDQGDACTKPDTEDALLAIMEPNVEYRERDSNKPIAY
jgi:hypothetical protein